MKKYILAIAAVLMAVCVNAQSVTIIKNGQTVATFDIDENTELVFTPGAVTPAQAVAGTYATNREVTLPAMAQMGVLVTDEATVVIEAEGDDTVTVTLPGCTYVMGGNPMELPGVTATDIAVTKDGDEYTIAGHYEGVINEKNTKVDISGTVKGGLITLTEDIVYGTMPMTLHMAYTNITTE